MNNEEIIAAAYKNILKQYRKYVQPASAAGYRKWFLEEYPVLDRGMHWNRSLYDMNVNSWNSPNLTGICLPTAMFVQAYLKDIHNIDSELVGLFDDKIFCHCVLLIGDKYHDVFWPEGTTEKENLMYGDICSFGDVSHIVDRCKYSDSFSYSTKNFFDKIKFIFYPLDSSTEKNNENLVDIDSEMA